MQLKSKELLHILEHTCNKVEKLSASVPRRICTDDNGRTKNSFDFFFSTFCTLTKLINKDKGTHGISLKSISLLAHFH